MAPSVVLLVTVLSLSGVLSQESPPSGNLTQVLTQILEDDDFQELKIPVVDEATGSRVRRSAGYGYSSGSSGYSSGGSGYSSGSSGGSYIPVYTGNSYGGQQGGQMYNKQPSGYSICAYLPCPPRQNNVQYNQGNGGATYGQVVTGYYPVNMGYQGGSSGTSGCTGSGCGGQGNTYQGGSSSSSGCTGSGCGGQGNTYQGGSSGSSGCSGGGCGGQTSYGGYPTGTSGCTGAGCGGQGNTYQGGSMGTSGCTGNGCGGQSNNGGYQTGSNGGQTNYGGYPTGNSGCSGSGCGTQNQGTGTFVGYGGSGGYANTGNYGGYNSNSNSNTAMTSFVLCFTSGQVTTQQTTIVHDYYKPGGYSQAMVYFRALPLIQVKVIGTTYTGIYQSKKYTFVVTLCKSCNGGYAGIKVRCTSRPYSYIYRRFIFVPQFSAVIYKKTGCVSNCH